MDINNTSNISYNASNTVLAPFEYHNKLRDHFKNRKKTWNWFSEESNKSQQIKEFKSNLLKNTYRIDRSSHENLYKITDEICAVLSIDADVTLYQENNSVQLNAGISILNKEAHIVFSGNLLNLLSDEEMKVLLAHELSHYLFFKMENGEHETTQRIILALANDHRSEDEYIETARIFQLYMELFCDFGALKACKDYNTVIQTLVKINTGLSEVNSESYINQAKEIVKFDSKSTRNDSHPESYIRCLALELEAKNSPDSKVKIKQMIEGEIDLNKLDIFDQKIMQEYTQNLLQLIVSPKWMHSSAVLNLCTQYFPDFYKNSDSSNIEDFASKIENVNPSVKNYFSYVLLDFAKIDPDMEGAPLGYTLEISELLDIKEFYEKIIRKELKLTIRDFKLLQEKVTNELQQMKEGKEDSLYND